MGSTITANLRWLERYCWGAPAWLSSAILQKSYLGGPGWGVYFSRNPIFFKSCLIYLMKF